MADDFVDEDVVLYRLPGERLGLGLRFEGGEGVSEQVRALFVKHLVAGAPAARAKPSWGRLQPGDEILRIQNEEVRRLTRLNCVNHLGDASVSIVLRIRHQRSENDEPRVADDTLAANLEAESTLSSLVSHNGVEGDDEEDSSEVSNEELSLTLTSLDDEERHRMAEKIAKGDLHYKSMPSSMIYATKPPTAEFYTDLLADEFSSLASTTSSKLHDSESDDTASSVSTVIEVRGRHLPVSRRASTSSSVTNFSDVPESPLTLMDQALGSFERLEEQLTNKRAFDVMAAAVMDDPSMIWNPHRVSVASLRRGNSALAAANRPHLMLNHIGNNKRRNVQLSPSTTSSKIAPGGVQMRHGVGNGRTMGTAMMSASQRFYDDTGYRRRSMDDQQLSRLSMMNAMDKVLDGFEMASSENLEVPSDLPELQSETPLEVDQSDEPQMEEQDDEETNGDSHDQDQDHGVNFDDEEELIEEMNHFERTGTEEVCGSLEEAAFDSLEGTESGNELDSDIISNVSDINSEKADQIIDEILGADDGDVGEQDIDDVFFDQVENSPHFNLKNHDNYMDHHSRSMENGFDHEDHDHARRLWDTAPAKGQIVEAVPRPESRDEGLHHPHFQNHRRSKLDINDGYYERASLTSPSSNKSFEFTEQNSFDDPFKNDMVPQSPPPACPTSPEDHASSPEPIMDYPVDNDNFDSLEMEASNHLDPTTPGTSNSTMDEFWNTPISQKPVSSSSVFQDPGIQLEDVIKISTAAFGAKTEIAAGNSFNSAGSKGVEGLGVSNVTSIPVEPSPASVLRISGESEVVELNPAVLRNGSVEGNQDSSFETEYTTVSTPAEPFISKQNFAKPRLSLVRREKLDFSSSDEDSDSEDHVNLFKRSIFVGQSVVEKVTMDSGTVEDMPVDCDVEVLEEKTQEKIDVVEADGSPVKAPAGDLDQDSTSWDAEKVGDDDESGSVNSSDMHRDYAANRVSSAIVKTSTPSTPTSTSLSTSPTCSSPEDSSKKGSSFRRIGQSILSSPFHSGLFTGPTKSTPTSGLSRFDVDKDRQSTVIAMIEERRKSGQKLRGLVIPEVNNSGSGNNRLQSPLTSPSEENRTPKKSWDVPDSVSQDTVLPSTTTAGIPKYSPAFKRKALSVFQYSIGSSLTPSSPIESKKAETSAKIEEERGKKVWQKPTDMQITSLTGNGTPTTGNNKPLSPSSTPTSATRNINGGSVSEESDGDSAVSSIGSDSGSGLSANSPEPAPVPLPASPSPAAVDLSKYRTQVPATRTRSIGEAISASSTSLAASGSSTSPPKPTKTYPKARRQFSISTEFPSKNKWPCSPDSRAPENIFLTAKNFWDSKTNLNEPSPPKPFLKTRSRGEMSTFGSQKEISSKVSVATIVDVVDPMSNVMKKFASEKNLAKVEPSPPRTSVLVEKTESAPVPAKKINWESNKTDGEKWNELQRKYSSSTDVTTVAERPKDLLLRRRQQERAPVKALAQRWEQMAQDTNNNKDAKPLLSPTKATTPSSTTTTPTNAVDPMEKVVRKLSSQTSISSEQSGDISDVSSVSGDTQTFAVGGGGMFDFYSNTGDDDVSTDVDGEVEEVEAESLGSRSSSSQELLLMGNPMSSSGMVQGQLSSSSFSAMMMMGEHSRVSSVDSSTSEESGFPPFTPGGFSGYPSSLIGSGMRHDFGGSVTSLASSTSLISPQELQQLMEEADSGDGSGTPSHEILVVVLHREYPNVGSVGITLAGGADYDVKDIAVHKVISGSVADRDGRVQRGDRVLSINGRSLKGLTHAEALNILKAPRQEVVLVLSRSRSATPASRGESPSQINCRSPPTANQLTNSSSSSMQLAGRLATRPPRILESPMDSKSLISDITAWEDNRGPPITIALKKGGPGLGFSLEGGKDSPYGDRPLTVKKIFTGATAHKEGTLRVGDELLSVNGSPLTSMSRLEAWNVLKRLPDGDTTLVIRQKVEKACPVASVTPSTSHHLTLEHTSSVKSP